MLKLLINVRCTQGEQCKHAFARIQVRSLNFAALLGGGVLHTKLWLIDRTHVYVGSANMDWRSLSQVKELGLVALNCSCLANDYAKIFDVSINDAESREEVAFPLAHFYFAGVLEVGLRRCSAFHVAGFPQHKDKHRQSYEFYIHG